LSLDRCYEFVLIGEAFPVTSFVEVGISEVHLNALGADRPRSSPIRNKLRLRVRFERQCSNMRHIETQYAFVLLTFSILSQKYRRRVEKDQPRR
jgi:hypothetical protein